MKKWLAALVVILSLCIVGGSAIADGGKTLPNWREVETVRTVEKGQTATVSTGIGSGYEVIRLVVKDTSGWGTVLVDDQNVSAAANGKLSFSINTSNDSFIAGHLYNVELIAKPTADGDPLTWKVYWNTVLTVVPAGTTGLNIYINSEEADAGYYGFYVTAYDPDAENVWIVLDGEAYQSRPGNSITWVDRYNEAGSHTVSAVSIDSNGVKKTTQNRVFTVSTKEDSALYAANVMPVTFTMGSTTKSLTEFPETITDETDISYTIYAVTKDLGKDAQNQDQQVWYDSWLDDLTDGNQSLELPCYEKRYEENVPKGKLLGDSQTVTIDHSKLITGHTYTLHVEITSAGRTPVIYQETFVVLPMVMNNQGITLSFNGNNLSGSSADLSVYEDFGLVARAEGSTLMRFWTGDHFEYLNNWAGRLNLDSFEFEWKTWWVGEQKYYIQAYYGEIGETPWDQLNWDAAKTSNILTVNATNDTTTEKVYPEYQVLSDTVTQGDYFTVVLTNTDVLDADGVYVGADLYNGNDISNHYDRTGDQILVPTADLNPGYYILAIYTETTGAGYVQNPHTFRVVANGDAPENGFMITTTVPTVNGERTVQSYEDFGVTFYAPDREGYNKYYRFCDGQNWWQEAWYDRSVTLDCELDPGTWEIYAEVVYEPEEEDLDEIHIESDHIQITATSRGDSSIVLYAPGSYTIGESGYNVLLWNSKTNKRITPDQYADEYWELVLEEIGEGELARFGRDHGDNLESSFTFIDGNFEAGKAYKVRLHLNVLGYNHVEDEVYFVATDPDAVDAQKLELAVDGYNTGSYVSVFQTHSDFNVKVTKSADITAVRVLNGDNWEIWWGDDTYERDWSFGYGIYGLVAQGTTDEALWEEDGFDWGGFDWNKDVNWSVTSNTVTVRINAPNGKLGAPTLTLDKTAYTRGEKIIATVGKVDGSEWYDLHVSPCDEFGNEQGEWVYDAHADSTGTGTIGFVVPTAHIEPGTYMVWVDNNGMGYQGNGSTRIIIQIEEGSQAPMAVLELPESAETNQNVDIYAFVPNADDIWLDIRKQGDPGWKQTRDYGESYGTWEFGEAFEGTYTFTLYGHVKGEEVLAAGPVEMEVIANRGNLSDAKITLSQNTITITENGASGGITGSFVKDARAEWYRVRLVYCGPNGDWDDNEIRDDFRDDENISNSFTYDRTDFTRAGVYEVQVTGGATGYNGTDHRVRILAMEAAQSQIELTVNGNDGSETDVEVGANENMIIRIHAPGATAIRLFDGERWEWWDSRCLEGNGWAEFERSYDAGEYDFIAQAAYDEGYNWDEFNDYENFDAFTDLSWTAASNIVHATVTADGYTDGAVIANIGTVTRGKLLAVTVTSAGNSDSLTRATSIDANIQHEDGWNVGNGMGSGNLDPEDYPYTFLFPTGNMEPGRYYVYVYSHALGYNTTRSYMTFEVVESDESPFIFEMQDGLVADQTFCMSAYVEGANHIEVFFDDISGDNQFTWDFPGNHIYNTQARLGEGDYDIHAIAYFEDENGNETGTRTSETIRRTVTVYGDLNEPVIHAEEVYSITEGISFTVDGLEQGDWWRVAVRDTDQTFVNNDGYDEWVTVVEWDATDDLLELYEVAVGDLTAGHRYNIDVNVSRSGYHGASASKNVLVVEAAGNLNLTVDVPDGYALNSWPSSKNLRINVSAPGSSAIRVWDNGNWDFHDRNNMDESGNYHLSFNINDEGSYTFVAQAAYDEINWSEVDWSNFSWDDLTWSATSNQIHVTIVADGQLDEPIFAMTPAAKPGSDLVISIPNPIQGQWYGGTIYFEDGSELIGYTEMEDNNTITLHIPENAEHGNYRAWVWTDAEGILGRGVSVPMVIEDFYGASTFRLPTNLSAVEEEAFNGVHMDIVIIQGNYPDLDLSFINGTGAKYVVTDGEITLPQGCTFTVISTAQYNVLK